MRSDIEWTELRDGMLQADYGTDLPVHSRIQRFWFDPKTGLLRRNDYTPVAADPNARVANIVFEHAVANGIMYASKRRVKTSVAQYGWVLPFPDFITIDVEKWRLERGPLGSAGDPHAAAAVLSTGGRLDHPGRQVRARDLL
jgi:hypothetical protein